MAALDERSPKFWLLELTRQLKSFPSSTNPTCATAAGSHKWEFYIPLNSQPWGEQHRHFYYPNKDLWHPEKREQELCRCLEMGRDKSKPVQGLLQSLTSNSAGQKKKKSKKNPNLQQLWITGHNPRLKAGAGGDGIHLNPHSLGSSEVSQVLPWEQNPRQGCEIWKSKLSPGQWSR